MPKSLARTFMRVVNVRAERVQDITEIEAMKEGFIGDGGYDARLQFLDCFYACYPKKKVKDLINCWVWVYEFEKVEVEQ